MEKGNINVPVIEFQLVPDKLILPFLRSLSLSLLVCLCYRTEKGDLPHTAIRTGNPHPIHVSFQMIRFFVLVKLPLQL